MAGEESFYDRLFEHFAEGVLSKLTNGCPCVRV